MTPHHKSESAPLPPDRPDEAADAIWSRGLNQLLSEYDGPLQLREDASHAVPAGTKGGRAVRLAAIGVAGIGAGVFTVLTWGANEQAPTRSSQGPPSVSDNGSVSIPSAPVELSPGLAAESSDGDGDDLSWQSDVGPVTVLQAARPAGPETIAQMSDEIVIVGTVVDSTLGSDGSGSTEDVGLRPVTVTVRVEQRLTDLADALPSSIPIRTQWLDANDNKLVLEGAQWLAPGDQIFTTLEPFITDEGEPDPNYSTTGAWTTFDVIDGALSLPEGGGHVSAQQALDESDDDAPVKLAGLTIDEAAELLESASP